MRFSGDVDFNIKLDIPLDDKMQKEKPLTYSGSAKVDNGSLFMLNNKIDITDGSGILFFTEKGLSSKNMVANILNEKATFFVSSGLKDKSIKIAVKGKMKPGVILKRFDIPGANKISGITSFTASIIFPFESNKNKHPEFMLKSNLLGVKSNLSDQFNKRKNKLNYLIYNLQNNN